MHHIENTPEYTALYFDRPVSTVSWAPFGGGRRDGIRYVINRTLAKNSLHTIPQLLEDTEQLILSRGMQKDSTVAMLTTASQNYLGRAYFRGKKGLLISAFATVGLSNAVAPGEHAAYDEESGQDMIPAGTINLIVAIERSLTENAALELIHTMAIAKASVMVELGLVNRNGKIKLATGTDCEVLCWDSSHETSLQFAGLHTRLAEHVSLAVRGAMLESLAKRLGTNFNDEPLLIKLANSRFAATR